MNRSHQEPGWTLIEITIAISIASVFVGTAIILLVLIMQHVRTGEDEIAQRAALSRLADQFCADVYQSVELAQQPGNSPDGSLMECHLAEGATVGYHIKGDRLLRTQHGANHAAMQESFVLPRGTLARVTLSQGMPRDIVALVLEYPIDPAAVEGEPGAKRRFVAIEALEGRDLRWDATPRPLSRSISSFRRDPEEAASSFNRDPEEAAGD